MDDDWSLQRKLIKETKGCLICCLHGRQCAAAKAIASERRRRPPVRRRHRPEIESDERKEFAQVMKYVEESPRNSSMNRTITSADLVKKQTAGKSAERKIRKTDEDEIEDRLPTSTKKHVRKSKDLSSVIGSQLYAKHKLQHSHSFTELKYKPLNALMQSRSDISSSSEETSDQDDRSPQYSEMILGESSPSNPKSTCPLKRYYIGVVSRKTSEMFVWRNTAFRVYHEISEHDSSNSEYPLYIVYKNSRGKYFHYPILERYDENLKTSLLYVDYGDDRCAEFMRLGALIKYYCTYASLHSYSQNSGLTADVFPWWLKPDIAADKRK